MFLLLSLILAAPPQFDVKAPSPVERKRRAELRCGGSAVSVSTRGDVGTFNCTNALVGVDVTDSLVQSELVVRGKIMSIETPPAKDFEDPSPQWKRATVKVASVLRGEAKEKTVTFLFVSSTKNGNDLYRKVKVGQTGIWILTRGLGPQKDLTMLTSVDDQPVSAEDYLKELLAAMVCPEKFEGRCDFQRQVCPGAGVNCTCEVPCGGGIPMSPEQASRMRWVCRPTACGTAKEGELCSPDGMKCEGCWNTHPFTCEQGRWKFHDIPPPP